MKNTHRFGMLAGVALLAACTTIPTGPSVLVMPGANKSFDQFRMDDYDCRQYAASQVGAGTSNDAAVQSGVTSAAVGALVGAAAGAAMGGNHQSASQGAGAGLMIGSLAGIGAGDASARGSQRRYDNAYVQCMYAKGESVPSMAPAPARRNGWGNAPSAYPPPPNQPPPGYPPVNTLPPNYPPPGYPAPPAPPGTSGG